MNGLVRKADFWSGLGLAALGCYIVLEARRWVYIGEEGPGPGFFPMWYGGAMIVLSLLLVAGSVLKRDATQREPVRWRDVRGALTCWASFAGCIALMNVVGFIPAFGLLVWFMMSVMFRQPHSKGLMFGAIAAVCFQTLFGWALDLTLPQGLLF